MKKSGHKWFVNVLFLIYMLVLFKLTVFRKDFQFENFMKGGTLNLSIFTEYIPFLKYHKWGHFIYLFGGNIVSFIPFGMYLWYRKRKIITSVFFGFLLSFFIESMQYIWGVGISETDDLILNTMGVFIGALLIKKLSKNRKIK